MLNVLAAGAVDVRTGGVLLQIVGFIVVMVVLMLGCPLILYRYS